MHEDMTEANLMGRPGLTPGEWIPGPLYLVAKYGGMLNLDEIVEGRKDILVGIHPATDYRRYLPVAKRGEVIQFPDNAMIVASFNPGYQIKGKDLKQSTRQRFVVIKMGYPSPEKELEIITQESGVDQDVATKLVTLANKIRAARTTTDVYLPEGASTRLLVDAGKLYRRRVEEDRDPKLHRIIEVCVFNPITDDENQLKALHNLLRGL